MSEDVQGKARTALDIQSRGGFTRLEPLTKPCSVLRQQVIRNSFSTSLAEGLKAPVQQARRKAFSTGCPRLAILPMASVQDGANALRSQVWKW
jgi:hypothetical protein